MRSKMLPVLVLLCFLFGMLFKPVGAMGQIAAYDGEATVYGKVVNSQTNNSISDATVKLWDMTQMWNMTRKTDIKGEYRFSIAPPALNPVDDYVIYVFHNSSADTFDYMPTKTSKINLEGGEIREFNFSLIPAATIYLEGDIYYVEGVDPSPSFIVTLTDPDTQKPYHHPINPIISYGDTTDNWFLGFDPRLVIVPAGIPVDLDVDARVWIAKLRRYTRISFLVDNERKHFVLPSSETYTRVRLDKYALKVSFDFVDERVSDVLETLENATRIGFYVTPLRERMLEGKSLAESAEEDLRKDDYHSAFGKLRMAIAIGEEVIKNLEFMKLTALLGSVLLLPFFAGYAMAGAFFLREKEKQKLFFSFVLYALEIVGFYYFYPGCKLMDFNDFVLSVVAFFAVVLFLVFGFPRIVKESLPGRVRLRAVMAQIFSIGKRNLKRKKLRTTLIIISISVLVLAFTAFTSVGRVYGIVREPAPGVVPLSKGGLIMDLLPGENQTTWNFLPLSFSPVEWLESEPGIGLIAPKAINAPQEDRIGVISSTNGRKQPVYGIVGVNASVEKQFTALHELEQLEQENDSIIISSEAAEMLKVDVGDELTLYLMSTGGYEVPYKNYTLVGIIDGSRLSDVREINGDPFLPQRKILEDETVKVVPVNSSDVILLPLMAALDIPSVSISRIAFNFEDTVQIDDLARKIIYVLEYNVWISLNGEVTWWHLGYYLEVKGGEILILFFIVMLQIATMMITIVKEREQEVKIMSTLGLNPIHIASVFLAESIVAGIIGGGLGYILGSSFYQLLSLFNINLVVRQKLEWYWSAAGLAVAVLASILSSVRSAISAAMSTVPSIVKRVRYDTEREKLEREKEIFKAFVPEEVSLPLRIKENDIAIFNLFILDGLGELKTGVYERVDSLEDVPEEETPQGDLVKRIRFAYYFSGYSAQVEFIMRKPRQKGFYSIHLRLVPQPGVPEAFLSHIKLFVNDLCIKWEKRIK